MLLDHLPHDEYAEISSKDIAKLLNRDHEDIILDMCYTTSGMTRECDHVKLKCDQNDEILEFTTNLYGLYFLLNNHPHKEMETLKDFLRMDITNEQRDALEYKLNDLAKCIADYDDKKIDDIKEAIGARIDNIVKSNKHS